MGYYIQTAEPLHKAAQLRAIGAEDVDPDRVAWPPPEGKALVCVVQNGPFDAAGVIFDESEFRAFNNPTDWRRTDWLLMDSGQVRDLSGAPV